MDPRPTSRHRLAEERSIAFHRAVGVKLESDPALLLIARERIDAWISQGNRSAPLLRRWKEFLERPLPELRAFLEDEGELACQLRQATPFAGALAPDERWAIWREVGKRYGLGP